MKLRFGYPPYARLSSFPVGALLHLQFSVEEYGRLGRLVAPNKIALVEATATLPPDTQAREMTGEELARYERQQMEVTHE